MIENQQPQETADGEVGIHSKAIRIQYFLDGFITGVGCISIAAFLFAGLNPLPLAIVFLIGLFLLNSIIRVPRTGVEPFLKGIRESGASSDAPYTRAKPYALWIKVRLQMAVGLIALLALLIHLMSNDPFPSEKIFELISYALAIAAVIELAHTLFTPGPDEALDPLALGLSAALLLQLAKLENFSYQQAIAALLYVLALGALFAIRRRWSEVERRRAAAERSGSQAR